MEGIPYFFIGRAGSNVIRSFTAIQKLFGSFKGDGFNWRVLPFFMRVMPDMLAKCRFIWLMI